MNKSHRESSDGFQGSTFLSRATATFKVSAPWSENQELTVEADLSFESDVASDENPVTPFEWQRGFIRISASDGSEVLVESASPASMSWVVTLNERSFDVISATGEYQVDCGNVLICPDD